MTRFKNFGRCFSGLIFILFVINSAKAENATFAFLEEYARNNSPLIKIIESDLNISKSERKHHLRFENPGLAFERESVEDENESLIAFSQTLPMPWVYGRTRSYWKEYENAGLLKADWRKAQTLAHLKTEYVRLVFMNDELEFLRGVIPVLNSLQNKLIEQKEEGWISGLQVALIQNSMLELDGHAVTLEYEFATIKEKWLGEMGFPVDTTFEFMSKDRLFELANCAVSINLESVENSPLLKLGESEVNLSEKNSKMEAASWIDHLELEGGLKQVGDDAEGIVVGLRLPLPLWNRNHLKTQIAREETRQAKYHFELEKRRFFSEVESRSNTCRNLQMAISKGNIDAEKVLVSLIAAYHEGQMNLSETLSALQGILQGQDQWRALNLARFANIFALEALTGQKALLVEEK